MGQRKYNFSNFIEDANLYNQESRQIRENETQRTPQKDTLQSNVWTTMTKCLKAARLE